MNQTRLTQKKDFVHPLVLIGVLALWLAIPSSILLWKGMPQNAGEIGDAFGPVNALFAGLAFAALVATIRYQQQEIKQNELALDAQITISKLSAQVAVLPALIEQEKSRLRQADPHLADEIVSKMTTESLGEFLLEREKKRNKSRDWLNETSDQVERIREKQKRTNQITSEEYNLSLEWHQTEAALKRIDDSLPFLRQLHNFLLDMEAAYKAIRQHPTPRS